MEPKIIDVRRKEKSVDLSSCVKALQEGKLVILPTETVYGIGADGLNEKAVMKIFEAKGRKQDNPLILHIAYPSMLNQVAEVTSPEEEKLIKAFMPGPFTLILKKKLCVPDAVTAGSPNVAVRMPSSNIAHRLIAELGKPIAAPSANLSGKPSGTKVEDIDKVLKEKVAFILDGGQSKIGVESTVVKVISGVPTILRPGKVTLEEIKAVCGKGKIDEHILQKRQSEEEKVESPGMKYRHYAPQTKCQLIYSKKPEKMIEAMHKEIKKAKQEGKTVVILAQDEEKGSYQEDNIREVLFVGSRAKLEEISRQIFTLLRKADSYKADLILIEGVTKEGFGLAIMNRLLRACEYQYLEI